MQVEAKKTFFRKMKLPVYKCFTLTAIVSKIQRLRLEKCSTTSLDCSEQRKWKPSSFENLVCRRRMQQDAMIATTLNYVSERLFIDDHRMRGKVTPFRIRCIEETHSSRYGALVDQGTSGFEILAFPCNQFLRQEPGTSQEAEQFTCTRFKAEYPIFQKVKVNGSETAPVYRFLNSSQSTLFGSSIKWNFTKFLVDKDGCVIKRYGTSTSPLAIEADIKKALGEL